MARDDYAAAVEAEAQAASDAVRARRRVDALLAERTTPAVLPVAEPGHLLTALELAKRLGVSVAHVRRLDPPSVCVGDAKTKRYDLGTVRAFLAEREPKATTPGADGSVNVEGIAAAAGLRSRRAS